MHREQITYECYQDRLHRLYGFLRSGYWDGAKAVDFTTLYCWCYKKIWGRWPPDINLRFDWYDQSVCWKFFRAYCKCDEYLMASYIRWAALKEKARKGLGLSSAFSIRMLFRSGGQMAEYRRDLALEAASVRQKIVEAANAPIVF